MILKYDTDSDVVQVTLDPDTPLAETRGERLEERRIVHYRRDGKPVAVELLFVSRGIDLEGLPRSLARPLDASARELVRLLGMTANTR